MDWLRKYWQIIAAIIGIATTWGVSMQKLDANVQLSQNLASRTSALETWKAVQDERWNMIQESLKRIDRKLDRR